MRVHEDVLVLDTKTQAMQCIARLVGDGYVHWTTGVVSWERVRSLVRDFRDIYLVHIDHNARYRRQRQGRGNARLVMYMPTPRSTLPEAPVPNGIFFALLVTKGEHPAHRLERLKHAEAVSLVVDAYELVRHTRAGRDKPSWTWRLTAADVKAWRDRIITTTRHKSEFKILQAWESLHRIPGYGGCRAQVRMLRKLFRSEVGRTFKKAGPFTLPPARHRYVSLMRQTGKPLHWYLEDRLLRDHGAPTDLPDMPRG